MKIVLMSDPRVSAIPVQDGGECLVDTRASGQFLVDDRKQDPDGHYAYLRHGLVGRLQHAQQLLPSGLRLLIVGGYRPPALQRAYFEEYATELRHANPAWSDSRIHEAASRYVSPPQIAPHSAGAAVDLTLADQDGQDGQEVDMGTRMNASPGGERRRLLHPRGFHQPDRSRVPRHPLPRHVDSRFPQLSDGMVAFQLRRPVLGARHRRADGHLRSTRPYLSARRHDCRAATLREGSPR